MLVVFISVFSGYLIGAYSTLFVLRRSRAYRIHCGLALRSKD
jgi:hypothetical protein